MEIKNGKFKALKGSAVCSLESIGNSDEVRMKRENVKIVNNILQEDVVVSSLSAADSLLIDGAYNVWES